MLARSSSENLPSGPRWRLRELVDMISIVLLKSTYPEKVLTLGSGKVVKVFVNVCTRSWIVIWSEGLLLNALLNIASVHCSSACDIVGCHYTILNVIKGWSAPITHSIENIELDTAVVTLSPLYLQTVFSFDGLRKLSRHNQHKDKLTSKASIFQALPSDKPRNPAT